MTKQKGTTALKRSYTTPQTPEITLERREKKRGRGRPPKIPIKPESEEIAQLMQNKARHISKDVLVSALKEDTGSVDVLDAAMFHLAVESSSLDFERGEAERKGEDTTNISAKKIASLRAVIDTWIKKREIVVSETFDFKSKRFALLFEFWAEKWKRACQKSGMSHEQIQALFERVGEEFENWEKDAEEFISRGL